MIRELRRRHRFAAVGLALLLPPAYAAALAARVPFPVAAASLAAPLGEPSAAAAMGRVSPAARSAGLALGVTLGRGPDGARVVELDSRELPAQPDALVYWSAAAPQGESLPKDVFFLGALPGGGVRGYRLPQAAQSGGGRVLVFSMAWQRVVFAQSLAGDAP